MFQVNVSCTSCWRVLCVCVWRIISAGVCFAMNCPSWVIFCDKRIWDWNHCYSSQHIFLFVRNVWQRSSASCPADLGQLWPLLQEFLPLLWRYRAARVNAQLWQKLPVSPLGRLLNLLALFVRLLLTRLDCCAGLHSLERWNKLLSSVRVQLRLYIFIVPLPKIGPTFLLNEPLKHLAPLTGCPPLWLQLCIDPGSSIGRTNYTIFSSVALKMIWFLAYFLSDGLNSVTANWQNNLCLGQTQSHPVISLVFYLFIAGDMCIWCQHMWTIWCSVVYIKQKSHRRT